MKNKKEQYKRSAHMQEIKDQAKDGKEVESEEAEPAEPGTKEAEPEGKQE